VHRGQVNFVYFVTSVWLNGFNDFPLKEKRTFRLFLNSSG
jgi:hypothetical protein